MSHSQVPSSPSAPPSPPSRRLPSATPQRDTIPERRPATTLTLSARAVGGALAALVALLALLNLIVIVAIEAGYLANSPDLSRLFTLDYEGNFPAWISSALLLVSAALLALHGRIASTNGSRYTRHWYTLALIFVLLSADETVSLHESKAWWAQQVAELRGPLFYAWVVPGMAFVAIIAIAFLPFLRHLPRATCWRIVLAGGMYVLGAIGMEMLAASYMDGHEVKDLTYFVMSSIEEVLELTGVSTFIYALLFHLQLRGRSMTIRGAL